MANLSQLAFEMARTQLASQKQDLLFLRNQAAYCAAVSGLIATTFANLAGEETLQRFRSDAFDFLGFSVVGLLMIGLFSGSIAFSILALIGWKSGNFEINPIRVVYTVEYGDISERNLFVTLTKDAMNFFKENETIIDDVKFKLRMGLIFAFTQIFAWVVLIFYRKKMASEDKKPAPPPPSSGVATQREIIKDNGSDRKGK